LHFDGYGLVRDGVHGFIDLTELALSHGGQDDIVKQLVVRFVEIWQKPHKILFNLKKVYIRINQIILL